MEDPKNKRKQISFALLAVLIVLAIAASFLCIDTLNLRDDITMQIPAVVGYVIVISFFVERAIEVFRSVWRRPEADKLSKMIELINKQMKSADTEKKEELQKQLEKSEDEKVKYSSGSRFTAQWIGLFIGVLISIAGIRILDKVVVIDLMSNGLQKIIFTVMDILLTGAVLAGGSETINRITKVYDSFMFMAERKNDERNKS